MHLVDITIYYSPENGAIKNYLTAKARWLSSFSRLRHSIVVPKAKNEVLAYGVHGTPSVPMPFTRNLRMPSSAKKVASMLAHLQPDCIEVGDPFQFAWASLSAKKNNNIPVAAFCHSDLSHLAGQRFGKLAEHAVMRYLAGLYRRFDLVLAPTAELAQRLGENGIGRVRHQPLGVDTTLFNSVWRDHKFRTRLALPPNARLLVHASRSFSKKILSRLVEAVEILGSPYHLLIIGAPNPSTSSQVSCVSLPQNSRALATLLASCDVMLHTASSSGSMPLVQEAMACGLPVVGENNSDLAELVDDMTGILVNPASAKDLAKGVQQIYEAGTGELGRNARRKMVQQYDWNHILPQLMAQYVSLIAGSSHTSRSVSAEFHYVNHQ